MKILWSVALALVSVGRAREVPTRPLSLWEQRCCPCGAQGPGPSVSAWGLLHAPLRGEPAPALVHVDDEGSSLQLTLTPGPPARKMGSAGTHTSTHRALGELEHRKPDPPLQPAAPPSPGLSGRPRPHAGRTAPEFGAALDPEAYLGGVREPQPGGEVLLPPSTKRSLSLSLSQRRPLANGAQPRSHAAWETLDALSPWQGSRPGGAAGSAPRYWGQTAHSTS